MLRISNYVRPKTLDEAYELCQKKSNVILGGMLWLKMSNRRVNTAIDLQGLGLDQITETADAYEIGAMVSLRALELHPGLNALTSHALEESIKHIVGVQFRNVATIGGSIYGRFGFSDILTLFLALDAEVELHKHGRMTVEEFCRFPRAVRDILVRVIVHKTPRKTVYLSQRNISTDLPVLTCAVSETEGRLTCVIGARPGMAVCMHDIQFDDPAAAAESVAEKLTFGSNIRAGAPYREQICRVLVRRALTALQEQEG